MKLVGKKLYAVGPLKCFKGGGGSSKGQGMGGGDTGQGETTRSGSNYAGGGGRRNRGGRGGSIFGRPTYGGSAKGGPTPAEIAEKKRKEKEARAKTEKVFTTKLEGAGKQAEARKMGQEAIDRIRSGEAGRVSREAALAGLVGASAAGGPGAKRMLQQQASGISRKAATEALAASKDVAGMAGKMRTSDIGLSKADKTASMKYEQLRLGEKLAREGMKAQVEAAKAGSKCFAADTKISTPSGQVYIKDIKVGDEVLSFDDEGQISVNVVTKVFEHEAGDIYKLSYWGGEVLVTTNHWILEANNTFLQVDKFNTDHCLVDEEGSFRPFKSLEFYEVDKTYNITVENDHTYIANGIRVHNFGGGKAEGGEILKRYAKGGSYPKKNGKIKGPGTETSDSIKARLSDGEFVVNAKTVRGIGEALGAKGKQPSRQKGSAYLYALQSKYGDTKAKSPKGLIPGYFGGAEVAQIAQQAAASGLLGKEAQVVGKVAGAGMAAKEKGEKAEAAKAKEAKAEAFQKKQEAYYDQQLAKGKPKEVSPSIPGEKKVITTVMKPRNYQGKKLPHIVGASGKDLGNPVYEKAAARSKEAVQSKKNMERMQENPDMAKRLKKGGDVKFGKGVKVRKKFLDSIGHKPFKHFEDKAEKDYKEGQTGYKNIKKRQSSSVPGFDFGITAAVMTAASMAKAEADRRKAASAARKQQQSQGEQAAAGELATTGKGIMKQDTELKSGGSVIDRPKLNVKKLSKEPLGKEYRLPEHGDDIDAPYKKELEPRSTKKPPLWMRKKEKPVKLGKGGSPLDSLYKLIKKNVKRGKESPKDIKERLLREKGRKFQEAEGLKTKKRVLKSRKKRTSWKDRVKKGKEDTYIKHRNKEIGLKREVSRQSKSDDSLAKKLAEKALRASKLRRGLKDGTKVGKHDDLLATDKTKKIYNQFGPKFAKKIKAYMTEDEPLIRSEKIGKKVYSPEKLKQMEKHHIERKKEEGAEAGRLGRKKIIEADHKEKLRQDASAAKTYEDKEALKREKSRQDASDLDLKRKKGARAFLLKQGLIPHKEMSIKERFADRARKRDEQDEKEAKQYEKKEGFFSKLGDRLSTGEWFGSSKDILAAKRKAKDKEQAKRERSGEDFKAKKAAQDDKIAMAKEMAAERKKGIEAKVRRENPFMAKPKVTPKVAPKVVPKVEAPEVKKKKPEGMTGKQWADMGVAGAKSLLGSIAKSKQDAADRKRARAAELRRAKGEAGKSLTDFGRSVMGMDTRLKGGGKVSFKDVLKAKKKMGY